MAVVAELAGWNALLVFCLSAAGVIPLAGLIGDATEHLAAHTGPKIGGLINATLGNAAELIITLLAINKGLLELVKASITGSIIGNLLFVLGLSILAGGVKNGIQKFDRRHTTNSNILLTIAIFGLVTPSLFSLMMGEWTHFEVAKVSLKSVLALGYLAVFGSIIAYTAYVWLTRVAPPSRVATYAYVNPIIADLS